MMTSPDFRAFVGTLFSDHQSWLLSHPSPSGSEFFDHYVGDAANPGLLWRYEAWRSEHGYTRVRPWNGSESLGRSATAATPFPGRVLPWVSTATDAGPTLASSLADGQTTSQLQAAYSTESALGAAILAHWNAVRTFPTPNGSEMSIEDTAIYSIRFWGFMKWASTMRNRWNGIPAFSIPIVWDAAGVPLSDIEYMDTANRWHGVWHRFPPHDTGTCPGNTPGLDSSFGQVCSRPTTFSGEEFMRFHRDLLDTYDDWRHGAGMPTVERWKPPGLHFHPNSQIPEIPSPDGLELDEDPTIQYGQIKDVVKHFNTVEALGQYAEGDLHSAGHGAAESDDIGDPFTNNYSPRFMAWHRWIDYLWNVREPRFDGLKAVASDGSDYLGVITVVRPAPNPDRIEPNNAITGVTADGRGSLWVAYDVRPETWGRDIDLTITAQVFRDSDDTSPVAGLDATPISISAVTQGAEQGPVELQFNGLDADGEGAFAREALSSIATGFKNGRIRITGHLDPVGNIPGSHAIGNANDQFVHDREVDVILVKETRPPVVTFLLNKSSFSVDEVSVNAGSAPLSTFANSFFVVLQDPPEPPLALDASSIFSDPARTMVSGIFADTSLAPSVDVVDEFGNPVTWFSVALTDVFKEDPSLPDSVSQRVLFRYLAIFDVAALSTLLPNAGDIQHARLRVTARDRAGNVVQDVLGPRIKLFRDANPYLIDVIGDNPSWLSVDTRVFSVRQSELKFGHSVASSGSPSQYIQDVIGEFNAGTQNFDAIPADAGQAQLELAPQVSGQNAYNFTLARVRLRSTSPVSDVRVFFRLFTTALSNLSFTATNYPSSNSGNPKALLGRTSTDAEIVSVPFFAAPRVETRDTAAGAASMTSQADAANVQTFPTTPPGGESVRFFGAYLDINSDTPRFPQAPVGDGPFPGGQCVSIRNILRGQHECMVAEVMYSGDPTEAGTTPAASDNLAQRNLVILETTNPGREMTRTVQHSFDLVLPDRKDQDRAREELRRAQLAAARSGRDLRTIPNLPVAVAAPVAMASASLSSAAGLATAGWGASELALVSSVSRGFDELVFLWNNLPTDARVQVYLPSMDVDYVMLLRDARRAPKTVIAIDEHTLSLKPEGVTFLPVPNIGAERIAGLLTITLPDTVKAGEVFTVDVLQVRPAMEIVVGAFQIAIPVTKALKIYDREARMLEVFLDRLKTTPPGNRWHLVLERQVEYFRARARELAAEAVDECRGETGEEEGKRVRVIVEKIKVLDAHGPLVHGAGRVSLSAHVDTGVDGGFAENTRLPASGAFTVEDRPRGHTIQVNQEIFRGPVKDHLTVEIWSGEEEEEPHCHYHRTLKGDAESLVGRFRPSDEPHDPENIGDWQLWYRIVKG